MFYKRMRSVAVAVLAFGCDDAGSSVAAGNQSGRVGCEGIEDAQFDAVDAVDCNEDNDCRPFIVFTGGAYIWYRFDAQGFGIATDGSFTCDDGALSLDGPDDVDGGFTAHYDADSGRIEWTDGDYVLTDDVDVTFSDSSVTSTD